MGFPLVRAAVLCSLLLVGIAHAELPVWNDLELLGQLGGDFTTLAKVRRGGRTFVLKSNRPRAQTVGGVGAPGTRPLTRWSNFEAELVAHRLFELVSLPSPAVQVVRLTASAGEVFKQLGEIVLAMELVNAEKGRWPGAEADTGAFIDLALIDIILGNADRTPENFFVAKGPTGKWRPIPIDNNCGLATFLVWSEPTQLVNFWPSFGGLGETPLFSRLGRLENILVCGGQETVHARVFGDPALWPEIRSRAARLVALATDRILEDVVRNIPAEVIPEGASVPPSPAWLSLVTRVPADAVFPRNTKPLFRVRLEEIRQTLSYRREHLVAAIESFTSQ